MFNWRKKEAIEQEEREDEETALRLAFEIDKLARELREKSLELKTTLRER